MININLVCNTSAVPRTNWQNYRQKLFHRENYSKCLLFLSSHLPKTKNWHPHQPNRSHCRRPQKLESTSASSGHQDNHGRRWGWAHRRILRLNKSVFEVKSFSWPRVKGKIFLSFSPHHTHS